MGEIILSLFFTYNMIELIIILLGCITIGSSIYAVRLQNKNKQLVTENKRIVNYNASMEEQNNVLKIEHTSLQQQVNEKKSELNNIISSVEGQNNILKSLTKTADDMRESAEERANQAYQSKVLDLESRYKEKNLSLQKDYEYKKEFLEQGFQTNVKKFNEAVELAEQKLQEELVLKEEEVKKKIAIEEEKISIIQEKLADLQAKQQAYIEAQRRQEAIAANKDYYRLTLDNCDLDDIKLLRDIQKSFSKKDVIDKLIWDYYKLAFDALSSRVCPIANKICGVYKITNLETGLSYIGQSVDIRERWRQHIKASLAYNVGSNKLYQTMRKQGPENFTFEILEEVPRNILNERETYWIDFYKTKEYGMNSTKGGA